MEVVHEQKGSNQRLRLRTEALNDKRARLTGLTGGYNLQDRYEVQLLKQGYNATSAHLIGEVDSAHQLEKTRQEIAKKLDDINTKTQLQELNKILEFPIQMMHPDIPDHHGDRTDDDD